MSPTDSTAAKRRALGVRLGRALGSAFARREPLPSNASIELRLAHLEGALGEVRSRVNGLFFAVLSSLTLELVGRVAL